MTDDSLLNERLARYLDGNCDPGDREAIRNWVSASPDHSAILDDLTVAWNETRPHHHVASSDTDALVGRWKQIVAEESSRIDRVMPQAVRGTPGVAKTAAVALGIAAAVVVGGMFVTRNGSNPDALRAPQEYITRAGQYADLALPGGVRIALGPSTRLIVEQNNRNHFTGSVSGQAVFSVFHDEARIVTIKAGNAEARVLGTEFLVRRYESDSLATVVVAEGKVAIQPAHAQRSEVFAPVVLSANMRAEITDSGGVRVTPNITSTEYTGWTTGHLVFRQTPVRDMIADLNRAYDARIRVADSALAHRALTLTVPVRKLTLPQVLDALSVALNAHVVITGDSVSLVPGAAAPSQQPLPTISYKSESQYGR